MQANSHDDLNLPGLALMTAGGLALAGAFVAQYVFDLPPCELCIYQRYPHGFALAAGLLALLATYRTKGAPSKLADLLCWLGLLALLATAGVGAFHAGVEYDWWQGLQGCSAPSNDLNLDDLKAALMETPVVRCDEVAWSLFGISIAGYNFLYSLIAAGGVAALILTDNQQED